MLLQLFQMPILKSIVVMQINFKANIFDTLYYLQQTFSNAHALAKRTSVRRNKSQIEVLQPVTKIKNPLCASGLYKKG